MAQPTVNNAFKVHNDFVIYGDDAFNLSKLQRLAIYRNGDNTKGLLSVEFTKSHGIHEFDDELHAYNMREYYMKTEEGVKLSLPANLKVKLYHAANYVEEKTLLFAR